MKKIRTFRFTRVLFGLNQSPFILGGTIDQHLNSKEAEYPDEVKEIKRSIYVDDTLLSGESKDAMEKLKNTAITIFKDAGFELHKWHSNLPELEDQKRVTESTDSSEQSYAKSQLGVKKEETKLLGLIWNKTEDTIGVDFPEKQDNMTKRSVLQNIASVYDPLGIVSPTTLAGKLIYRDACDLKVPWDAVLPESLQRRWTTWMKNLPSRIEIPRSITCAVEPIESIELHAFGDSSSYGTLPAVYIVVCQNSGVSQGLLTAKSRVAKKGLTIPRLELTAGHMAANLISNVKAALDGLPVKSCYGWLDSTVALHWIKGSGEYKQFVENRVRQIRLKDFIVWRHVGTKENPADVGSRGSQGNKIPSQWFSGPEWLANKDR